MISKSDHIFELVFHNQALEVVLDRFEIPAISESTLGEVCQKVKINEDLLVTVLNMFDRDGFFPKKELYAFPVPDILDYLKRTHQYYIQKRIPEIEQSILFLATRYGRNRSLGKLLYVFFVEYKNALQEHIELEETRLFPHIEKLFDGAISGFPKKKSLSEISDYSVQQFMYEHTDEPEDELKTICQTVRAQYPELQDYNRFHVFLTQMETFEKDLKIHGFVEDEILIPRILGLENIFKDALPVWATFN